MYVTKDSYDPTKPLTWDEMEDQPFLTVDHPPLNGTPARSRPTTPGPASSVEQGGAGRHIIYMVWQRSDSTETFYSCSDVVFDGGNGEVTGVHDPGHPTEPPPGTCTASRKTIGTWPGGHQSENGSLSPGQSTTFGYVVQGSGGDDSITLPCQVG